MDQTTTESTKTDVRKYAINNFKYGATAKIIQAGGRPKAVAFGDPVAFPGYTKLL